MATFQIPVLYTQIAVFLSELEKPFSNWTDRHVAQGFSWRPGSVSFRTFDDGDVVVTVLATDVAPGSTTAERVILVPFHVPPGGTVEVGSIFDTVQVDIVPGDYALTFEHGHTADGKMHCTLRFTPVDHEVRASIVRRDAELSPEGELLMVAEPA